MFRTSSRVAQSAVGRYSLVIELRKKSFDEQELDRKQARGWLEKDMYFTANPGKHKLLEPPDWLLEHEQSGHRAA